ncbi:MAG: bifunctional DNA-formamidopyrimidine glycosylase/DNA-(apurinic or apyrimidinic site) lyase [Acidimicrobiales bacterium]|nr:bifunctional DNA-formamidopyrimidine glycosylase/DNA-(apurinic or apyrimidinic site) lyase [Acidimicrobiales bacterium]
MPELPEVETIRRQLEAALPGAVLVEAWAHPSAKFASAADAVTAAIEAVGRRGKYLLFGLDDGRELVAHLGMTGGFSIVGAGVTFNPSPYCRAWWRLDDGRLVVFDDTRRFGRLAVVRAGCYDGLPTLAALGPEPWDPTFTPTSLWEALRHSGRRLKTQVLSQRPVAGVGNIYADEAFWRAEVHPARRTLTRPQATRLHGAIIAALEQGLRLGGTTLRDYRSVDGSAGANQFELSCYGRAELPCLRCGALLRRAVFDGRSTTFCAACQGPTPRR